MRTSDPMTSVLMTPKHDFKRVQRKHYPYINNISQVLANAPEPKREKFTVIIGEERRGERRHYCTNPSQKSHLDDFM